MERRGVGRRRRAEYGARLGWEAMSARAEADARLGLLRTQLGERDRVALELVPLVPLGDEVRREGEHHA